MRLEKIELKGFKSFAGKTVLTFPEKGKEGRGITAVVGPNGSGKSNIADAIRWCLGEQSMKNLRAKNGGDIIFSGSSAKGRLSMAEVSLFLNNEDKKAPIDYTELVITRRCFRNGESEYLINNSKTKLGEIQMLLAKSNFGQKSYSVIGQGMVENFLGSNPAERKEFFDEATGVKQFQIKREEALRKLIKSHENISQANMLISEIEPHLKNLTRQVNKLKKKHEIEKELKVLRTEYFRHVWHDLNNKFQEINTQLLGLEQDYRSKTKELEKINEDLSEMERDSQKNDDYIKFNQAISELYVTREEIIKKTASIQTQLSMEFESAGNFDLSWLFNRENELKREIEENKQSISQINNDINNKKLRSKDFEDEKNHINNQISNFNQKLFSLSDDNGKDNDKDTNKKINAKLQQLKSLLSEISEENNVDKIKAVLQEIRTIVHSLEGLTSEDKKDNSSLYVKQREIQEKLIKFTHEREVLIERSNDHSLDINSLTGKIILLKESLAKKESELKDVLSKINKNQSSSKNNNNKGLEDQKELYEKNLVDIDNKINITKEKLNKLKSQEEEKRSKLFRLQREGQSLQTDINETSNQINSIQINSAKYETRLEGVEASIREVIDNIKTIQEVAPTDQENINIEEAEQKIKRLVGQCNLIGGIDPEIEKEYEETKNKYDFLFAQSSDIENTINSLDDIIKELDKKIKEKFTTEFKIICNKFEDYFKILFGGGSAKIIKLTSSDVEEEKKEEPSLVDAEGKIIETPSISKEDALTLKVRKMTKTSATGLAGIDIQANPPGKVIKSLNVLSGGEKAMTAIALICAIINVNPSPFVVLDEIDAALDESNAERLSKILVTLSHKTQFIVVTHNRAPMHKADVLYGVTMKDDGISQLLSIQLKDYLKDV